MTQFTKEEKALYERSSKRVQRFILVFWRTDKALGHSARFDRWMEIRWAIHAASIYAKGKNEDLLDEWYNLAGKRIDAAIEERTIKEAL